MKSIKNKIISFLLFVIAFITTGYGNANNIYSLSDEETKILAEQSKAVQNLIKVAHIIDHDDESYWAYETADSIINTISSYDSPFYIQQSKIYSALNYIFYGMSYTSSVTYGQDALDVLSETNKFIVNPISSSTPEDSIMLYTSAIERSFISAYRNFYFVSNMESTQAMVEREKIFDDFINSQVSSYSGDPSKFILLNNKKLFNQTFAILIVELEMILNNGEKGQAFVEEIMSLSEEQDKIETDNIEKVCKLSDEDFIAYLHKGTHMQSRYIQMLADRIAKIK